MGVQIADMAICVAGGNIHVELCFEIELVTITPPDWALALDVAATLPFD